MILIICILLTFIVSGYFVGFDFLTFLMSSIIGIIITLLLVGVAGLMWDYEYVHVNTIELAAFKGGEGLSGSFILGTGDFETEYNYRYLTREEDGGIKMGKIDSNLAIIYEVDETPRLEQHSPRFTNKIVEKIFITPLGSDKYKIYIPPNSIMYEYNLEL